MFPNKPLFNPPPQPTHGHAHREPPGGPPPYVAVPADPNFFQRERDHYEQNYWAGYQRPGYFIASMIVNLGAVGLLVFKMLRAVVTFDRASWVSDLGYVILATLFLGAFIMSLVSIAVMVIMNILCSVLTGKGLYPVPSDYGNRMDDTAGTLLVFAGMIGLVLAVPAWIVAGLLS